MLRKFFWKVMVNDLELGTGYQENTDSIMLTQKTEQTSVLKFSGEDRDQENGVRIHLWKRLRESYTETEDIAEFIDKETALEGLSGRAEDETVQQPMMRHSPGQTYQSFNFTAAMINVREEKIEVVVLQYCTATASLKMCWLVLWQCDTSQSCLKEGISAKKMPPLNAAVRHILNSWMAEGKIRCGWCYPWGGGSSGLFKKVVWASHEKQNGK